MILYVMVVMEVFMVIVANKDGLGNGLGAGYADRFAVDGVKLILVSMDSVIVGPEDEWDDTLAANYKERV